MIICTHWEMSLQDTSVHAPDGAWAPSGVWGSLRLLPQGLQVVVLSPCPDLLLPTLVSLPGSPAKSSAWWMMKKMVIDLQKLIVLTMFQSPPLAPDSCTKLLNVSQHCLGLPFISKCSFLTFFIF